MLEMAWWLIKVFLVVIFAGALIGWLYGKTPAWFRAAISSAIGVGVTVVRKWISL